VRAILTGEGVCNAFATGTTKAFSLSKRVLRVDNNKKEDDGWREKNGDCIFFPTPLCFVLDFYLARFFKRRLLSSPFFCDPKKKKKKKRYEEERRRKRTTHERMNSRVRARV
jgi:hypothetical protein|tara:strand:+ start:101 stop:436 length:336 start_codon:yes stop_codon:yes gene_type:complete